MNMQEKIENWIKDTLKIEDGFVVEHPADLNNGDYSTNAAMVMAGKKKKNPKELAKDFGRALSENKISEIEKIEAVGGFINFFLDRGFLADKVKEAGDGEGFGKTELLAKPAGGATDSVGSSEGNLKEPMKILIEHTQPNPFKEFHIGHLMNNAIGESLTRILRVNGAEVTAVGYHGDVGLHVAKAIWGKMKEPTFSWGEAYAFGAKSYEENKEEIRELNKKIFDKSDKEINELYEQGRKDSMEFFESIYKRLGSEFDHHFFESETGGPGTDLVMQSLGKVFERSEGAVIFRGENFEPKTHTRVFVNSDGLPVYEAKEMGLAKLKFDKYKYDQSITITANEQDAFFKVVEVAMGLALPEVSGKLTHLSHGMLRLPSGKMSSRTGEVIKAEDLIDQVKEKVLEKINERGNEKDGAPSKREKEDIAEAVAIGAIKYSILRQAIGGDIIFDFEKSISFEGDSGPYLQYTAVRAHSVLEKAKAAGMDSSAAESIPAAAELERYVYRYPEIVERAGKEFAPHYLVTYLTELASLFNSFYAKEKIIDEEDEASPYKIALTRAVANILKSGLDLLGIKVPEKM